jgi:hypothetical protein
MRRFQPRFEFPVAIDGLMHEDHLALPIEIGAREREELTGAGSTQERGPADRTMLWRQGTHESPNFAGGNGAPSSRCTRWTQPGIVRSNSDSVRRISVEELVVDGVAQHRR